MGIVTKSGRKKGGWLLALALAGGITGLSATVAAQQGNIPWKAENFQGQFFEADIKAVLRQIVKQNGLDVIFRPEVAGEVTMEFEKTPLEGAFNRIIGEYQLDYNYDESSKTITVLKIEKQTGGSVFLVPKNVTPDQVITTLRQFELMGNDVKYHIDPQTGALFLRGPAQKITEIRRIVDDLDKAYLERSKNSTEIEKARMEVFESAARQKRINEVDPANLILEVRKLKFANVGQSTVTFQGQPVAVPGIADSLKAFVGNITLRKDEEKKSAESPGKVYPVVDVDARTNSVIIQGSREQVDKVLKVLDKLDQPVPMIEIEVMIVSGVMGLTRNLGVEFGYSDMVSPNSSGIGAANTGGASSTTSLGTAAGARAQGLQGAAANNVDNFAASGLGLSFLVRGTRSAVAATLAALSNDSTTQFISAPKVVTLNNRQAKVSNTNNVSISTTSANNGASQLQTVAAGLTLTITPAVIEDPERSENRLVRMEISATNTTPSVQQTAAGTTITTSGQDIQTSVLIPEYSTFVLGGLYTDDRQEVESGVPLLMDVPVLGNLFKYSNSANNKRENAFILTPRIYDYLDVLKPRKHWARDYVDSQREILDQGQKGMLPEGKSAMSLRHREDE
ncbi:MAG: type II secretion system protein GspD [Magnetococcales bacterium]|nr:type II secretion system protein GspD [Magnetococcales bacterium]NGZ28201.1 type II secretion system protein GspD [Magnetococcales bacterium]